MGIGLSAFDAGEMGGKDPNWCDPYPNYIVTQGLHAQVYGQMAVDLTAGKGAHIRAPVSGVVTGLFSDQYNNTTLVIQGDRYIVTMLHGNYWVSVGQHVEMCGVVGEEWNNGYTLDANGNLCAGRDCGYHTHLNIFDMTTMTNIDPFTLLSH